MANETTILAIESAVRGGSIAISRNGEIVDTWFGEGGISRAEDLLWNVDRMLKQTGIAKVSLTQIVVSVGPGSFTGIRIGLATAMGLAIALNIDLAKYSILQAMITGTKDGGSLTTVIPVGRGVVCMQTFRNNKTAITELSGPIAMNEENFQRKPPMGELVTAENFSRGLAVSLINAASDPRIPRIREPLFIAKPANI